MISTRIAVSEAADSAGVFPSNRYDLTALPHYFCDLYDNNELIASCERFRILFRFRIFGPSPPPLIRAVMLCRRNQRN